MNKIRTKVEMKLACPYCGRDIKVTEEVNYNSEAESMTTKSHSR